MQWFDVPVKKGSGDDLNIRPQLPAIDGQIDIALIVMTRDYHGRRLVDAGSIQDSFVGSVTVDGILDLSLIHI